MNIQIRHAEAKDLISLTAIYNHAVTHTTATFDLEEQTLEQRKKWIESFNFDTYPLLVAEMEGAVAGYACLSPYRSKPAYARTVELSVYVDPAFQGKGVGSALMADLLERAREAGHHAVLAGITGGNGGSVRLHRRFGFREVGCLQQVGWKFGAWQDVYFYQLTLDE
ncbi:GNAT family N-acetyltransferase [Desmospora activa]|uniref:Phosphinothricin acetyltransferase n=1 Tax=Desmospora activa DSM 45169 TaxID=1121389 RepID=A0A2T4Z6X8_9BACL|nr:GNAT family N-acetyltransferase [Desmospora activa]PTM57641.1 phosphinothricin acetyltransferase [Desmospora activa DSM 45169]